MSSIPDPDGEDLTQTLAPDPIETRENFGRPPTTDFGMEQKETVRRVMGFAYNFEDVGFFHEQFGLPSANNEASPQQVDTELLLFRIKFMFEELFEFLEAVGVRIHFDDSGQMELITVGKKNIDHAQSFDSLLDLVYVAMGTAHVFGYPWQRGWMLVQLANMSKERAAKDGSNSKRESSFDVIKPEGWQPPDIGGLLRELGWDA